MNIQSRLPDVGTTIFSVMSKMALDYNAINLSQGFPDFPIDNDLVDLVNKAMIDGHNQYAPMPGASTLRNAIAAMVGQTYKVNLDAEKEILVTAGATQAIFCTLAALVNAGDEVIVFDPCYDSYDPGIRLNGGIPIHINLKYPFFEIDWDEVEARISNRTRIIIVNTPHNPSGTVLGEYDLQKLELLAIRHGLIVLSDEVYERLIFDGLSHQSVLRFPALAARSLACFSFGKTFHATGWKVGYVVGPETLIHEVKKVHQYVVFSVNNPVQIALAQYINDQPHLDNLASFYQRKRDFFLEHIKGSSLEPLQTRGSYFQLLSYKNFSTLPDLEVATLLTQKFKVASIPVSVFYQDKTDHHVLRFCFAKKEETLLKACEILRSL